MKKIKIKKFELRDLILNGITSEDLNKYYDYSHITDMSQLFYDCKTLTKMIEIDTSNVSNMSDMFKWCLNLESVPNLKVNPGTNVDEMFYHTPKMKFTRDNIDNYKDFFNDFEILLMNNADFEDNHPEFCI